MDKFTHPLARYTSWLLIYLTAAQPLHPAIAAGITAANGNTQVVMAPGNIPVVNIAPPNAAGISHNTYKDFNVDAPGAVLNNATQNGKSQLGVAVTGNTRLNGKPAELIINEVTSGNRSELKGKLEVFGDKAGVMIANPNGITCDGCGFINTPSVTLTTGKPQFDKQGALEVLEVKKGAVIIGGKGLDGASTEYVDIISRASELNGKITAKTLTLTQGANRISYKDGTVKSIAGEGTKPLLAVDTKALGGMYAGKIRLVATEDGVGVNLSNLNATRGDITLTADGHITLGNVYAKTDLNVSAKKISTATNRTLRAERDVTLSTSDLDNQSNSYAGRDMRIFSPIVRNTSFNAQLKSGDNLWIQKDVQGNKATLVENRFARIQTLKGDLIIRAETLNNTQPLSSTYAWEDVKPDPKLVNSTRKTYRRGGGARTDILIGGNGYLNVSHLNNDESEIKANNDLILTGKTLNNISGIMGTLDTWSAQSGNVQSWKNGRIFPAILSAGGNLVADFSEQIDNKGLYSVNAQYSEVMPRENSITARKNILLRAGSITTNDAMNAGGNITLQSDKGTRIALAQMTAGKDISVLAGGNIESVQSELKGQNITLVSRSGHVTSRTSEAPNYFNRDGTRWLSSLEAPGDLSVTAGGNIWLENTRLPVVSQNISLVAGGDITLAKTESMLGHDRPDVTQTTARKQELFNLMLPVEPLRATGDITLSGRQLALKGASLDAGGNISLSSAASTDLNTRNISDRYSAFFPNNRIPELRSQLKAGGNLLISSAADISAQGTDITAGKTATLQAGKLISLGAYGYGVTDNGNDNNRDEQNVLTRLHGAKGVTLAANGGIQANGSTLTSDGNITLTSGGNMQFQSAQGKVYREFGDTWSESVNQTGVTLNAGGALTLISGGSILFQASRLLAKGAMDVAAKGGWLYAQAMEESSHYVRETTKRKWWGKKTTVKQTTHTTTNRVTEFTAGGNISLLSRDDSTYEASKIEAGKNARLTSTNGKVNFLAVKNTSFEQTVSTSKGFFIKQADKGYNEGKWVLPSVYTGGTLTVNAASGISADVKVKNGQALQGAITALGLQSGTEWLKGLNTRSDVQWNTVKDAYDGWNYTSQSLNPAVAAVIAIAAAAVTAGSSLVASTAAMATSTVGGGAMMTGAVTAGMSSLAAQAAVALVENQGNLSKTLAALGSSSSVKSLATSMVIGGALAGFDKVMNVDVPPAQAKLPALVRNEDWGKIVQRVAGQSVISSSLNTTINGGSFRDSLVNAMLANIGNQINAEGAGLIGDNGEVLGLPGRALSHAVVSGISAEIGRGNGKGAAAGALAAELAAIILDVKTIEPEEWQTKTEHWAQIARVAGAVSGAVFTGESDGAYSGANSAENVTRFNHQQHLEFMFGEAGVRYYQGVASLGELMDAEGNSPELISAAFVRYAKGSMPEGQDVAKGIIVAWGEFFGVPLGLIMSNETLDMKKALELVAHGAPIAVAGAAKYIAAKSLLKLSELKYIKQAEGEIVKLVSSFTSKTKAGEHAVVVGAYDVKTGKYVSGLTDKYITAEKLDARTVSYIENKLNTKIGSYIETCKNRVGACAEVSAADQLIRQGVRPEDVKFTDSYRTKSVYADVNKELKSKYIIDACENCKMAWPEGVKK